MAARRFPESVSMRAPGWALLQYHRTIPSTPNGVTNTDPPAHALAVRPADRPCCAPIIYGIAADTERVRADAIPDPPAYALAGGPAA